MGSEMERLNRLLTEAASKLDKSAALITELNLEKVKNHERIAEALANIFEIQHQIYRLKPELRPEYLRYEILDSKENSLEDQAE